MTRPRRLALSTRLLGAVVALLALICLLIGLATHTAMRSSLYAQLDDELRQASERALAFGTPSGATDPLDAPGQASGTLNARVVGRLVLDGGVLDTRTGQRRGLADRDAAVIAGVRPNAQPVNAELSLGPYRLMAVDAGRGQGFLVTGLPLAPLRETLAALDATMLLVSAGGLAATALAGTVVVRRSLRPLERVSAVAASVASLPLEAGEVSRLQRVPAEDAVPGTEAGDVGHALNALLDNVESALEVRRATEERMRRFVADASHELRTPLSSIRGYAELLAATEHLSDDGRRSIGRVVGQARRMGTLVENLLLLARLDEHAPPRRDDVDLVRLLADAVRDFEVAAPGHAWRLEAPGAPVRVRGDADQLAQVVANLLANARKHTPEGTRVTVSLRVAGDDGGAAAGRAVVAVADNGPGIPAGFLPRVFERFARADGARSGADGTTGLGLPIARAIVRAHGGGVDVRSRPGETVFEVSLPLAGAPVPPPPGRAPRVAGPGGGPRAGQ